MVDYKEQELMSYLRNQLEVIFDEIDFNLEKNQGVYIVKFHAWNLNKVDYEDVKKLFKEVYSLVNIQVEPTAKGWTYYIEVE
jgi:hypothetical protein